MGWLVDEGRRGRGCYCISKFAKPHLDFQRIILSAVLKFEDYITYKHNPRLFTIIRSTISYCKIYVIIANVYYVCIKVRHVGNYLQQSVLV